MFGEWWSFYQNEFYEDKEETSPVLLWRNLRRIDKTLSARGDEALRGLVAQQRSDHRWASGSSWRALANIHAHVSIAPLLDTTRSPTPQFTYTLDAWDGTGDLLEGVIELSIYSSNENEGGQLVKWIAIDTQFQVDGNIVCLTEPVSITGPNGQLVLEVVVPERNIHIRANIVRGETTGTEYEVRFLAATRGSAVRPQISYYHDDELLVVVDGYRCPFTGREFTDMDELLEFHAAMHLNLAFSLHPFGKNAMSVVASPLQFEANPWQTSKFIDKHSENTLTETQWQRLYLKPENIHLDEFEVGYDHALAT